MTQQKQHFLLSAKARTLSLKTVFTMGEEAAYNTFRQMRWPETDGEAFCPRCGCTETYDIKTRRKFKCMACHHQFSVTSGTMFASRKLPFGLAGRYRDIRERCEGHCCASTVPRSIANIKRPSFLRTSCARQWRLSNMGVNWTALSRSRRVFWRICEAGKPQRG